MAEDDDDLREPNRNQDEEDGRLAACAISDSDRTEDPSMMDSA